MKLTKTLPLIPVVFALASCGQTETKVALTDPLISVNQTMAPADTVVYPDDRPSIPDGKVVWEKQNCASCHGADGSTKPEGAKAALNDHRYMAMIKPVDLYKALSYGKLEQHHMQGKLSSKDTWNLVFYARSLGCTPLTQGEIDEVNAVFGSNCAVCHGTKGDGEGPLARNLEPNPANFQTFQRFYDRTDDTLFDHIANGIKWEGMPNFLGKTDKKKNVKFDHAYIKKLVAYVRNFHVSNAATTEVASAATAAPKAPSAAGASDKAKDAAESTSKTPEEATGATGTETSTGATPEQETKSDLDKKADAPKTDNAGQAESPKNVINGKPEDKTH